MGLLIKAALGALIVVLIAILSRTKNYYFEAWLKPFNDVGALRVDCGGRMLESQRLAADPVLDTFPLILRASFTRR